MKSNWTIGVSLLLGAGVFSALETVIPQLNGWFAFMAWAAFIVGWAVIIRELFCNQEN